MSQSPLLVQTTVVAKALVASLLTPQATKRPHQIRCLNEEDIEPLLALYRQLNPEDLPLEPVQVNKIWEQSQSNESIRYLGLFVDGQLVSACQLLVIPNFTRLGKPYALIENVITDSGYRNQGHGKALLKHAVQHAWQHGCYKVMLMSGRKEASVMKFYRSAGFNSDEKQAFTIRAEAR